MCFFSSVVNNIKTAISILWKYTTNILNDDTNIADVVDVSNNNIEVNANDKLNPIDSDEQKKEDEKIINTKSHENNTTESDSIIKEDFTNEVQNDELSVNDETKDDKLINSENSKIINDELKIQNEKKDCPICLGSIDNDLILTICQHNFHKECLESWLNESQHSDCPLCRTDLSNLKTSMPQKPIHNIHRSIAIDNRHRRNINSYIISNNLTYRPWNDKQASSLNTFYGLPNRGTYQSNPYGLHTSLDYSSYPFN